MARVPLYPRGSDIASWALNITQRIERDYAEWNTALRNISVSGATDADLRSLSAVLKADLSSVSGVITTAYDAAIRSTSVVIKTDISSVSSAITTAFVNADALQAGMIASDLRSLSIVIKLDISSVSAAIMANILSSSADFNAALRSLSLAIKTDISSVSAVLQTSINAVSNTVSTIAVRLASVSATVSVLAATHHTVINAKGTPYGAVGDGVADDTAALRLALPAARGGVLYLPGGQYKLYGALTLTSGSVHILGAGMESTELTWAATATSVGIVLLGTTSTDFHHVSDVKLSTSKDGGVALICDYSAEIVSLTGSLHIVLDRVSPRSIIERVFITGVGSGADPTVNNWYEGIDFVAGLNCTARDINIVCKGQAVTILGETVYRAADTLRYGINFFGNPAGNTDNGHPVVIYVHNCNINYPYIGVQAVNVEGVFVTDNNIIFGDYGIYVNSGSNYGHPQTKITGNHINMYQDCIQITGQTQNTIADNLFYQSQAAITNASGINVQSAYYVGITNNQFQSWSRTGSSLGINVASKYVSINGNVFKQWSNTGTTATMLYPIVLQSNAQNIRGAGNVYAGTFAANILTVAGASDILLDATGGGDATSADLRSLSLVIKADLGSVSAAITTAYVAADRSTSVAIQTTLNNRLPVCVVNVTSTTNWTAPTINKIYNVLTVSRSAVGTFRVWFSSAVDKTLGLCVVGNSDYGPVLNEFGSVGTISFTTAWTKVYTSSIGGTLVDVDQFNIVVFAKSP